MKAQQRFLIERVQQDFAGVIERETGEIVEAIIAGLDKFIIAGGNDAGVRRAAAWLVDNGLMTLETAGRDDEMGETLCFMTVIR